MISLETTNPSIISSRLQTMLANEELIGVKSAFYPRLSIGANSEYSKKYSNLNASYIGDESLVNSSGFASSLSLKLNYELYKFNATSLNVEASKEKIRSLNYKECDIVNEAKLKLLEIYHKILDYREKIGLYNKLKEVYKEIYELSKRLYEAGDIQKTLLANRAIELVEVDDILINLKKQSEELLSEISNLSGIDIKSSDELDALPSANLNSFNSYNSLNLDLNSPLYLEAKSLNKNLNDHNSSSLDSSLNLDMSLSTNSLNLNKNIDYSFPSFEQTAKAKELNALIASKQLIYEAKKKDYFPAVYLYAKYDFYGDDKDSLRRSIDDTQRNGYRIGLSISYNLFDGFSRESEIKSALIEVSLAKEQFEEARREYEKDIRNLKYDLHSAKDKIKTSLDLKDNSSELLTMSKRLNKSGEAEKLLVYQSMIKHLENTIKFNESLLAKNMLDIKYELTLTRANSCKAL
ncbi:type I secretion system, outer membrane protein, TolC family [Campylobacter sp. RM16192]|nr:type I secretion system, outer membrane protein, TolC family [Campylobacter sp. RM16192]